MRSERIVATSILCLVLVLALINSFSTNEQLGDTISVNELVTKEYRTPTSMADIDSLQTMVKPILYADVTFIEELSIPEAKQTFINIMVPAILVAKYEINFQREQVLRIQAKNGVDELDSTFLAPLYSTYRTNNISELLDRMKTHPTSIVLGQAAIESGWGRSRFFKEANNIFGVWSMNSYEDRIPAKFQRNGKQVFLRRYPNISASIKDYFLTIGKVNAYKAFRAARNQSNDYHVLIEKLDHYSERGMDYVADLERMIRLNGFEQYDSYQLDPAFIN